MSEPIELLNKREAEPGCKPRTLTVWLNSDGSIRIKCCLLESRGALPSVRTKASVTLSVEELRDILWSLELSREVERQRAEERSALKKANLG